MGGGASKIHKVDNSRVTHDKSNHAVENAQVRNEESKQVHTPSRYSKAPQCEPCPSSISQQRREDYFDPSEEDDNEEDDYERNDDVKELNDDAGNDDMELEDEEEDDNEEALQLRMLFAQSAMSMDMDNEDLIFNLLYFGGDTSNFATMMNNAAEETVAAHSAGNTPYKLTPATATALKKLNIMTVTESLATELNLQDCLICQEEFQIGDAIAAVPNCNHCFHNDCVLKWFTLQSWCPVCRTKILPEDDKIDDNVPMEQEEIDSASVIAKANLPEDAAGSNAKTNLQEIFYEATNNREEEVVTH